MKKGVWRAYYQGRLIGERRVTANNAGSVYRAVLYDPETDSASLWSTKVESAEREVRYAAKRDRKLILTTEVRLEAAE